ncbi:MAG TPA: TetR/AcrR family transcriptional regulator [Solirubrobacteraceae bacterium]|jgi:TetR/AcrR family transcriptional repressor of nem operon|nr:TetR/AcrR family transcriptional regulator [Solirubrobacteraceae bacterium]
MSAVELEPVTPKGRRTRLALLEAGAVVAERHGLAGMSVAAVAEQAGVAKGTFYLYFPDRDAFIDALHQRFYARVSEAVAEAVDGLAPGTELLLRAIDAYLDVCLENHAVKALVFETRAQGELTTTMEQREELFSKLAQPSLAAMGMRPAPIAARLFVAMTSEAALIEMQAGHRVSGARNTIRALAGERAPSAGPRVARGPAPQGERRGQGRARD